MFTYLAVVIINTCMMLNVVFTMVTNFVLYVSKISSDLGSPHDVGISGALRPPLPAMGAQAEVLARQPGAPAGWGKVPPSHGRRNLGFAAELQQQCTECPGATPTEVEILAEDR